MARPILQVVFTAELRRRLPAESGIVTTAVHPGEVMTDVVRTLPGLMQTAYRFFMRPFCLSPAEGLSSCGPHSDLLLLGSAGKITGSHTVPPRHVRKHGWDLMQQADGTGYAGHQPPMCKS